MAKEMIAMILAGGQGSRLYALTQKLAPSRQFRLAESIVSSTSRCPTVSILTLTRWAS